MITAQHSKPENAPVTGSAEIAGDRRSRRAELLNEALERQISVPDELRDYDEMVAILQQLENLYSPEKTDHLHTSSGARVLTATNADLLHSIQFAGTVCSMDFSPNGRSLAVASQCRELNSRNNAFEVRIFDLTPGSSQELQSPRLPIASRENVHRVAFSPAGDSLIVATEKHLHIFRPESVNSSKYVEIEKHTFDSFSYKTHAITFDASGSRLVVEGEVISPRSRPIASIGWSKYQLIGFDLVNEGLTEIFKFSSQYPYSGCAFARGDSRLFYSQNSDEIRRGEKRSLWRKITLQDAPYCRFYRTTVASLDWHDVAHRDGNHVGLLSRESSDDFHGYLAMKSVPGKDELELLTRTGVERLPMDAKNLSSLPEVTHLPGTGTTLIRRSFQSSAADKRGIFQTTEYPGEADRYLEARTAPAVLTIVKSQDESPSVSCAYFNFHQHGFSQSDSFLRDTYTPFAFSADSTLLSVAPRKIIEKDQAITVLGIYELLSSA
jgi:hypothetical protein